MSSSVMDRNLAAAFAFSRAMFDDPALQDEIPDGATVIVLPDNDPELFAYNLELARRAAEAGENVYLRHVRSSAVVR